MRRIIGLIFLVFLFRVCFAENHFINVWSGNGYQQMNIVMQNVLLNSNVLSIDDEIAVFDGIYCVGSVKLTAPFTAPVTITASCTDGMSAQQNGFIHGHAMTFKVWKSSTQTEYTYASSEVTINSGNTTFSILGLSNVSLNGTYSLSNVFPLSLSSNPLNAGNLYHSGNYVAGKNVVINTNALPGYIFTNWKNGATVVSTSSRYGFTMPSNAYSLEANFQSASHLVSVSANPFNWGTVSGSGTYGVGAQVQLHALPNEGYLFLYWTLNGTAVSLNPNYSLIMPNQPLNLVANFIEDIPVFYTLNLDKNPDNGGSVNGAGQYEGGASVVIQATPAANYQFLNWTQNGMIQSTNPQYSFIMPEEEMTLTANFQSLIPLEYTLSISVSPQNSGNVLGMGNYTAGSSVSLHATPNLNYSFVNWTRNGIAVSSDPNYTFTMPAENTVLIANFIRNYRQLSLSVNPTSAGSVSGAGVYAAGEWLSISASPSTNFDFVNWTKNGIEVSTDAIYSFYMPDQFTALVANFTTNENQVVLSVSPQGSGSVTGAGTYSPGQTVQLTANPHTGYSFLNWMKNGNVISTSSNYSFSMPNESVNILAQFVQNQYSVTYSTLPANSAQLTGSGTYTFGQAVSINAIPATGYSFVSWKKNNLIVSTGTSYQFSMPAENVVLVAHLQQNLYSLSLQTLPANGGSANGSGNYVYNSRISLHAQPQTGYVFQCWKKGDSIISVLADFEYTMPAENVQLMAVFSPLNYNLSLESQPENGGTLNGAGTYHGGEEVHLIAVPAPGYHFVGWKNGDEILSQNSDFNFIMPFQNTHLVAEFSNIGYQLSINAVPSSGGIVSGAGVFNAGTLVALSATANPGYNFLNWKNGDIIISESASFNFTMPFSNANLSANFLPISYPLQIRVNPANSGIVTGSGAYSAGTQVTLQAIPAINHTFINWTYNGQVLSTSNQTVFTMPVPVDDVIIDANFSIDQYQISLSAEPFWGGSYTGSGTYNVGQIVNLQALPEPNHRFLYWKNGAQIVSTNALYIFNMPAQHLDLTAYFEEIPATQYALSLSAVPQDGGTVSGGGLYLENDLVTISAIALPDYRFINWTVNNILLTDQADYSFSMPAQHLTYTAHFQLKQYTVSINRVPLNGGSVSGAGTYISGRSVSLQANASTNYHFVHWLSSSGDVLSTNEEYIFIMPENNVQVFAHFALDEYQVSASVNPANGGSVNGTGAYAVGSVVTLIAQPALNYHFVSWTNIMGIFLSDNPSLTFYMPSSNLSYFANFALDTYTINLNRTPSVGGTVSGSGTYAVGANVQIQAIPAQNYHFVHWKNAQNEIVSTESTYSFAMPASPLSYTAVFALDEYQVSLGIQPENSGSVSGGGSYAVGANVQIQAIPAQNYHFIHWINVQNQILSTQNTYSMTMPAGNVSFVAVFALDEYTLSLGAQPSQGGTVQGAGLYEVGESITVSASASNGYYFSQWTKNGLYYSNQSQLNFTMPAENMSMIAQFLEVPAYELNVSVIPEQSAVITGIGSYVAGQTVTVRSTPNHSFTFSHWERNGQTVSYTSEYSFIMPAENVTLISHQNPVSYTLTLISNPSNAGVLSGAGSYFSGTPINIHAIAHQGYVFQHWKIGTQIISELSEYTYLMPSQHSQITAVFTPIYYALTLSPVPVNGGTVNGSGSYTAGTEVHLSAQASTGYTFTSWKNNGQVISENANDTFMMPYDNVNLSAEFSPVYYQLSITSNPQSGGSTIGSGSYLAGTNIQLQAYPEPGYAFQHWRIGDIVISESQNFIYTMPFNHVNLIAGFTRLTYQLATRINPSAGGIVTGTGNYFYGSQITLQATPAVNYSFVSWTINDEVIGTSSSLNYTMPLNDVIIDATFAIDQYQITLSSEPQAGGSMTGAGTYEVGQSVNLQATPSENYRFLYWKNGTQIVSTNSLYIFNMPAQHLNLTAHFDEIPPAQYALSLSATPQEGGTVSGDGLYHENDLVTITATPHPDYQFVNWTANNTLISDQTTLIFNMPAQHLTYTAHFQLRQYSVIVNCLPEIGGSVNGTGNYLYGHTVNLLAIPAEGYRFLYWKNGSQIVSNNSLYTFNMPAQHLNLTAYFEEIPPTQYNLSLSAVPQDGGTVSGGGLYLENDLVTITAVPNPDYRFINWKVNNSILTDQEIYSFNMPAQHLTYTAHFQLKQYTVSITRVPLNGGSVSGAGTYISGRTVTLQANASTNYHFVHWLSSSGDVLSTNEEYIFIMPENNVQVFAHFALDEYQVSASVNPANGGSVNGTGAYAVGSAVTLVAQPALNYHFVSWTNIMGVFLSDNPTLTFFMPASNLSYFANFALDTYTLNLNRTPSVGGTVSGSGTYAVGANVQIQAIPAQDYHFVHWKNAQNEIISTESTYSFAMPASSLSYTAVFALDEYQVSLAVQPDNSGSVSGGGSYAVGTQVNVQAIPAQNYHFIHWTNAQNQVLSTQSQYSFTMPAGNVSLVAVFALDEYTLSLSTQPSQGGTVQGAGLYEVGENVVISAQSNLNYHFVHWKDEQNNVISEQQMINFLMPAQSLLRTAVFTLDEYEIQISVSSVEGGQVSGQGTYSVGSLVNLTALAYEHYHFVGWYDSSQQLVSDQALYSFTMPANSISLQAVFALNQYQILYSVNPPGSGSVNGSGIYPVFSQVILEAVPEPLFRFLSWTDQEGNIISQDSTLMITVADHDTLLVAHFELIPVYNPAQNLIAMPSYNVISLFWEMPENPPLPAELTRQRTVLHSFKVFRNDVQIAQTTESTYSDADVVPNENYEYYVVAVYNSPDGESIPSNAVESTLLIPVFNPPQNLQAVASDASVFLQWDLPELSTGLMRESSRELIGFMVYRDSIAVSDTISTINYMDQSVQNDSTYTYYVIAVYENPDGYSLPSNEVSAHPQAPVFNPPQNLSAEIIGMSVRLTWEMPEERHLSAFKLYRNQQLIGNMLTELSYLDENVTADSIYDYYVKAVYIDPNGESDSSNVVRVQILATEEPSVHVNRNGIRSIYPNPFNPETSISFSLIDDAQVQVNIYNIKGERVICLTDAFYKKGVYQIKWTGKNEKGHNVSSGVYFCHLKLSQYQSVRKMILLK